MTTMLKRNYANTHTHTHTRTHTSVYLAPPTHQGNMLGLQSQQHSSPSMHMTGEMQRPQELL